MVVFRSKIRWLRLQWKETLEMKERTYGGGGRLENCGLPLQITVTKWKSHITIKQYIPRRARGVLSPLRAHCHAAVLTSSNYYFVYK